MKPRYGHGLPPHKALFDIINAHRDTYAALLKEALSFHSYFVEIIKRGEGEEGNQPVWNNDFLPGLDMVGIYTMLASKNPTKYIEVGSGNSTKVAFKAKQDHALRTEIISIDPQPRAEIDHLADTVIRKPFEDIDHDLIFSLGENDILFIDNSHRILPNSDSMVFYLEILPQLKPGVIVHIHDIYLPYDYPDFMCDRFYSEQYGLAMYLMAAPDKYLPLLANYFISEDPELKQILAPLWNQPRLSGVESHGGSFWLQIAK